MGLSKTVEDYLLPTFNAIVQIPVLGWLPFALLFNHTPDLTSRIGIAIVCVSGLAAAWQQRKKRAV